MTTQNLPNDLVNHLQHSDQNHMYDMFNHAIKIKEQRFAEQLSYLSSEEMEKLMDEVDAKRPKLKTTVPKSSLVSDVLLYTFLFLIVKKLVQ